MESLFRAAPHLFITFGCFKTAVRAISSKILAMSGRPEMTESLRWSNGGGRAGAGLHGRLALMGSAAGKVVSAAVPFISLHGIVFLSCVSWQRHGTSAVSKPQGVGHWQGVRLSSIPAQRASAGN